MFASGYIDPDSRADDLDPETSLAPFRLWAKFWESRSDKGAGAGSGAEVDKIPRRRHVWQAYYRCLSHFLRLGSTTSNLVTVAATDNAQLRVSQTGHVSRQGQITELRYIETIFEGLLLKEIPFPEANEVNVEIDQWVDQVMVNWRIICGTIWQDEDVGKGGQEAFGRNVLDVSTVLLTQRP